MALDGPSGELTHGRVTDLLKLAQPGDLMVFNDTRVIPARLFGRKATGGKVEVLVERVVARDRVLAHVRASKSPKSGTTLDLEGIGAASVMGRQGELFELLFTPAAHETVIDLLERHGHMPLPPYIERPDNETDRERYQTVYARHPGAVAAPTAGLHFDDVLLDRLRARGVEFAWVTLHVGAGTFQSVRADDIRDHHMHSEWMSVSPEVCQQVAETRARGSRVIAVGTTSVRCLESAARSGEGLAPFEGDTDIFIYPGYEFQVVDALVTNFHLPESTLLMLVSAFAGYRHVMAAYQAAVAAEYRFFSYGDAMFLTRNPAAPYEAQPLKNELLEDQA